MLYFQIAVLIYILAMFVVLLLNYRGYVELPPPAKLPTQPPLVTVIVPTPQHVAALRACLESLGRQDYPQFEVLVVDDGRSEEVSKVLRELVKEYAYFRILIIPPASSDWSGEAFAQHQGALESRGQWLLFLDTDLVLQPGCISRCVAYCLEHRIDFFSLMPGHELRTFAEKLIMPIVFGWFGTRFAIEKVNDPRSTQAVAVRHFMLIRQTAYQTSGGFQKVKSEILEDSALSREIKGLGMSYRLMGGRHLITSRIYGGLPEIWRLCMRMFVGEVGSSPLSIFWTFMVIGLTGVVPFASVLWCAYKGFDQVNFWILFLSIFQCVVVLSARLVLDYVLRIGPWFAFLHPIGSLTALMILFSSLFHVVHGDLEPATGRVTAELQEDIK